MNKKIILSTILFGMVLFVSVFIILQNKNTMQASNIELESGENQQLEKSQIIFFYGDGCPHCAIVEKYFKENNIGDKISFVQKEVYHNQDNAKELEAKAKICGLPTNSIGVPFLWGGKSCLIGDKDIIEFFDNKIN